MVLFFFKFGYWKKANFSGFESSSPGEFLPQAVAIPLPNHRELQVIYCFW